MIAQTSMRRPIAAANWVEKIEEKCKLIAATPEFGEWRPEDGAEIRSSVGGRYVVFFRPFESGSKFCVLSQAIVTSVLSRHTTASQPTNDQRNRAAKLRVDFIFRPIRRSGSRNCSSCRHALGGGVEV